MFSTFNIEISENPLLLTTNLLWIWRT